GPFAGGFPSEGYVYGTNHYARLFQYMILVGTATRAPAPGLSDYAGRVGRSLLHAVRPNRWQVPDEADYPRDDTGVLQLALPLVPSGVAPEPVAAQLRSLLDNPGTPPEGVTRTVPSLEQLLYRDPARPARDWAATEPLTYYSPGDEHLFMRSSWS